MCRLLVRFLLYKHLGFLLCCLRRGRLGARGEAEPCAQAVRKRPQQYTFFASYGASRAVFDGLRRLFPADGGRAALVQLPPAALSGPKSGQGRKLVKKV